MDIAVFSTATRLAEIGAFLLSVARNVLPFFSIRLVFFLRNVAVGREQRSPCTDRHPQFLEPHAGSFRDEIHLPSCRLLQAL